MKYTDRMMELPIIMYNDKALDKAHKEEQEYNLEEALDVPFIIGKIKLPPAQIIGYYQTWTRAVSFTDAQSGILDAVIVLTESMGTFQVYLSLETFERRLNEFMGRRIEETCIT